MVFKLGVLALVLHQDQRLRVLLHQLEHFFAVDLFQADHGRETDPFFKRDLGLYRNRFDHRCKLRQRARRGCKNFFIPRVCAEVVPVRVRLVIDALIFLGLEQSRHQIHHDQVRMGLEVARKLGVLLVGRDSGKSVWHVFGVDLVFVRNEHEHKCAALFRKPVASLFEHTLPSGEFVFAQLRRPLVLPHGGGIVEKEPTVFADDQLVSGRRTKQSDPGARVQ